jgi:hypothetical protein
MLLRAISSPKSPVPSLHSTTPAGPPRSPPATALRRAPPGSGVLRQGAGGAAGVVAVCPLSPPDPAEPAGRPVANQKSLNTFGEFDLRVILGLVAQDLTGIGQ